MKNLFFLTMVIFSLSLTSCGINLDALLAEMTQPAPSSDTSSGTSSTSTSTSSQTSPAPNTPLPPPQKNGGATTRSDSGSNDKMAELYKTIKLSDTQITEFEAIVAKYKKLNSDAKLKYKGNQIALNKELKNLQNAEIADFKAMMSAYQYSLFEKELKAQSKSSTKGSVGG